MSPDDRFYRCLAIVLNYEGGFVNDPLDPGGATNHGITIETLTHWRGHPCTVADVQNLSLDEAGQIYRASYWSVVAGDQLPAGVDLITFDCAVNQGPGTAAKLLQQAVGATQDGHIGPNTLAALRIADPVAVAEDIHDERLLRYRQSPAWGRFGKGWTNRLTDVTAQAVQWAQEKPE